MQVELLEGVEKKEIKWLQREYPRLRYPATGALVGVKCVRLGLPNHTG